MVDTENTGRRSARNLDPAEIDEFLRQGFWGVLSMADNNEPYAVPIVYAYDEDHNIFIANGPGKKAELLLKNPQVTLAVVEVEDYGRKWRSVIVSGRVALVEGMAEKLHAFNALRKQIPRSNPRLSDAAKLASAKVVRLVPSEITGKAIGY